MSHRVAAAFVFLGVGLSALPAVAQGLPGPLVSTVWLRDHLGDPDLTVVQLTGSAGPGSADATIPGAAVSPYPGAWQAQRPDAPWSLPAVSDLEALAGSLGIGEGTSIVLVPLGLDGTELGTATWPYWVLRYLGHEEVAILDGGLAAWRADPANPTAPGAAPVPATGFAASLRPEILVGTAEVVGLVGASTVILDARSADQYRGESMSGLVVRPGHIPGAINLPFSSFYDEAGHRLRPLEELTAIAGAVVPDRNADIVVYCNTGHWSSIVWFVLHEVLGYPNVRLYEESMAQWSRDAALPLVLGASP